VKCLSVVLVLLLSPAAWGQGVQFKPAEAKVPAGRLASVEIEFDGEDVQFAAPPELDAFREYDPDPKKVKLRLLGQEPGTYRILAVTTKGKKLSPFATFVFVVEGAKPKPGPVPPPVPDPKPDPHPEPPLPPSPVKVEGVSLMIVYEKAAEHTYTPGQLDMIYSPKFRDALDAACPKGPDGVPSYRIWPATVEAKNAPQWARWAYARGKAAGAPWIGVYGTGRWVESRLPERLEEGLALLAKVKAP
jgi:hypothetical protein